MHQHVELLQQQQQQQQQQCIKEEKRERGLLQKLPAEGRPKRLWVVVFIIAISIYLFPHREQDLAPF